MEELTCPVCERTFSHECPTQPQRSEQAHDLCQICDVHNAALAAEREKRDELEQTLEQSHNAHESCVELLEDTEKQLLAAQAAIARHNKQSHLACFQKPISIDLSVLDKHDEEVRKPLVDALNLCLESLGDPDDTPKRLAAVLNGNNALSKVSE